MINIKRGLEPESLKNVFATQITKLRNLGSIPQSKDIDGYRVVSSELWHAQHFKCCYCERVIPEKFNDVEHFRPKASAARSPGCTSTHGYWWLSFSWENLLFACPGCNRSNKNDAFPLKLGSVSLTAEEYPPGAEVPLLIDPAGNTNPTLHLEFYPLRNRASTVWWVRGRNGSELGQTTVKTLNLNAMEYRELRSRYVEVYIEPAVQRLNLCLASGNRDRIDDALDHARALLNPRANYVALASDALRFYVPNSKLTERGVPIWAALDTIGR